ncbi:MAG: hypothetical protein M8349_08970 [ANME-2 cluster archaeon]|nr:hypothetical protein [ANME-2 cluster archaeon]
MGTMTINVNDDVEKMFRKVAASVYGKKKGSLGRAISDAMQKWLDDVHQKEIAKNELKLLNTGFSMGKVTFTRDEVHER